ncbi:MAG: ABC transporter ATP-binding protein [Deltaproteobacteria bacterium]|nr:ABC transporter ATP-binding protein [Deltaproteobacteria bacterium]
MTSRLKAVPLRRSEVKEKVLCIDRLSKGFHTAAGYLSVLDDVSFEAESGELIAILGRSGCGKSTLLKIVAGFIPPGSGNVLLNQKPVTGPGPDRCVIFQEDALFPWLTVGENIAFGLKGQKQSGKSRATEMNRFLKLVGLNEFRDYLPGELSGGMKQRVALARVLILKPSVLLMDEPFASLDAQSREEMQNLLLRLWKELSHTILFVTHDVNEAVILADRILLMDKNPGRVREEIRVNLPRPRKRESSAFMDVSRRLNEALRD